MRFTSAKYDGRYPLLPDAFRYRTSNGDLFADTAR
jgi:hypothetical protein